VNHHGLRGGFHVWANTKFMTRFNCRPALDARFLKRLTKTMHRSMAITSSPVRVVRAFLVEHSSLNHRYYTRELWDKAISENADVVTRGKMLGTIGHEQPIDDKALLEGKISHRVSKIWIDESSRLPGFPDAR